MIFRKKGEDKMVNFWEAFEACPFAVVIPHVLNDEYENIKFATKGHIIL